VTSSGLAPADLFVDWDNKVQAKMVNGTAVAVRVGHSAVSAQNSNHLRHIFVWPV